MIEISKKRSVFEPENLLLAAVAAAREAGRAILAVYDTDFTVAHKADRSPLTLADQQAHTLIKNRLAPLAIPLLSEEGRTIPYAVRRSWETLWIVDPLDGTKEFIKRNGEFTVNIALVRAGRPVLGVIFVPVQNRLYWAADEYGAYRFDPAAGDAASAGSLAGLTARSLKLPLPVSERPYTIMGSRSHANDALKAFVDAKRAEVGTLEFISAGSSLKFCRVAEGLADIYPRLGPTMEWDTAAGQAIVENAGRRVCCRDSGLPLSYNRENLVNPYFIVS